MTDQPTHITKPQGSETSPSESQSSKFASLQDMVK